MGLRIFIGIVVSTILWAVIIHMSAIPTDRFLPPAFSLDKNITEKAWGYVTTGQISHYGEHWMDGNTNDEYYENYKFQPKFAMRLPDGTIKLMQQTTWQTGQIQIDETTYNKLTPNDNIQISYDPYNPLLNGATGTGKVNVYARWWSPWIWYWLGFIAVAIIVEELCKRWIISDL